MSNARTLAGLIDGSNIVVPSGGIAFTDLDLSNDAATANEAYVLGQDGYEQGTFTADFTDSVIGSVGTETGSYTKIGNMVSVLVYHNGTFPSASPSGTLTISGLPFTTNNIAYGFFASRKVAAGTTYRAYLFGTNATVLVRADSSETDANTTTLLYTNNTSGERAGFSLTYLI